MTYREGGPHSFFMDIMRARSGGGDAFAAQARLERHRREMDVELEARRIGDKRDFEASMDRAGATYEQRTNPNTQDGQGGYLAPPLWLVERAAMQPASGRPIANLCEQVPLPLGVDSVNIPRLTAGALVADLHDISTVQRTDITDAAASQGVVTIAGQVDASMQLLEQSAPPGFDVLMWKSLELAYGQTLEADIVNGSGTSPHLLGLANTGSISAITFTQATPTPALFWPALAQAIAQVGDNRKLPPQVIAMTTSRWIWLHSAVFQDGTNASPPVPGGPGRGFTAQVADLLVGDTTPIGHLAGFPTFLDGAIPTTLGAGSNQDLVVVTRPSDHLLLESEPVVRVMTDVLSGTLSARVDLFRHVVFLGGLYPSGTATIGGTGMVVQSSY